MDDIDTKFLFYVSGNKGYMNVNHGKTPPELEICILKDQMKRVSAFTDIPKHNVIELRSLKDLKQLFEITNNNLIIPRPSKDYTTDESNLFYTLLHILIKRDDPFFKENPNTTITIVNCGETYSVIASLYKIADKGEHYKLYFEIKHDNYLKTSDIFGDRVYDVERYSFDNMSLTIDGATYMKKVCTTDDIYRPPP